MTIRGKKWINILCESLVDNMDISQYNHNCDKKSGVAGVPLNLVVPEGGFIIEIIQFSWDLSS